MTDRPIIFAAPMVLALLAGRKTQTRRLATSPLRRVKVGDRLWVREAWLTWGIFDDLKPSLLTGKEGITYLATASSETLPGRRRPGMHMPRWASRLTLTVEAVRVEPLCGISEDDAKAEGVFTFACERPMMANNRKSDAALFADLWGSLHDREGERWQDNPDVVALTFRVERRNIDGPLSPIHVDGGRR